MDKKKYILSVQPVSRSKKYQKPSFINKNDLQKTLVKKGLNIVLGEILKGGTVSQVYSGYLNSKPIVVKHTEDLVPFDPTEFFISKKGHNIDSHVLNLLAKEKKIKTPKIFRHFPEIATTIMEDMRCFGYELMSEQILKGKLLLISAPKVAKSLASLAQISRKWKNFGTNESAEQSIYERGLELRLAYPNTQKEYLTLEKEFVSNNQFWVWPDGYPKNIFINENGEVALIDFGRSCWGDQRYMLPNFLAHIVIFTLTGHLNKAQSIEYIENCTSSYKELESVDEEIFCQYLAMEVLHRTNGKWIEGVDNYKQKIKLYTFSLRVFDEKIDSVKKLLSLLKTCT